jgi:hypothetical protein
MMFTGGEEGVQQELTELLTFRNQHKRFWATRGIFDLESDSSGNLVIVNRVIGNESVVSIVNTSSTETVALPADYAKGWNIAISDNLNAGKLEPFGFMMATK